MSDQIKLQTGLYSLFLERLAEAQKSVKKEIIPFPEVYKKLCSNFSITKRQCFDLLSLVRDFGFIEIVPFHGIRINKTNAFP